MRCMVPFTHRLDVNKTVRKRLKVRSATPDETRAITGMNGGVTLTGLPAGVRVWVEESVMGLDYIISGAATDIKAGAPPGIFLQIADCEIVSELARPRDRRYRQTHAIFKEQRRDATPERHATAKASNIQNGWHARFLPFMAMILMVCLVPGLADASPAVAGETLPCEVMVKFEDDEVGAVIYRLRLIVEPTGRDITHVSVLTTNCRREVCGPADCRLMIWCWKPGTRASAAATCITGRMAARPNLMTGCDQQDKALATIRMLLSAPGSARLRRAGRRIMKPASS